ncbi:unnamed protein product [Anisakis simplex]|uniref:RNA helicase n=1 Tax=Anisakis simplex TaxID=6269 RepID=A0A0M3K7F3_ANISI|nr:unnamed protein product [Anisakis simplex]
MKSVENRVRIVLNIVGRKSILKLRASISLSLGGSLNPGKNSQRNAFNILNCQSDISENVSFKDFNLDERLLKAIGELGWEKPTQVQQNMIELALEDKNILARARTGSGKTGAFMIPVVQKILHLIEASCDSSLTGPFALFIAPTRELATQVISHLIIYYLIIDHFDLNVFMVSVDCI